MGISSKSLSFCRYMVRGEVPEDFLPWVDNCLQKYQFLDIDDSAQEKSVGWVELGNLLETDFQQGGTHKGEYLAFSLRIDTRKVPPALFRKHYLLAESTQTRQRSRALSRTQKAELKETVMQELLRRQMPQPHLYDVVWSPAQGRLWLFSTSPKVREVFETLFRDTFELDLYLLFPYTLAQSLIKMESQWQALESLSPSLGTEILSGEQV
ncbi:MAG: recombination-associated protein RdgC [Deltaproteobacteria bacterium]|nr:recombination-associated protein RdgC [Deltaproteobacteria bacterium]MBW1951926.1 recombination-associated protein RdgC [Deltaproteobacteria bacterium]MBW1986326.1 recombination-associated protein RdgC [Deltaproteobacteria bacterium]MBW2134368.1 recombination-associated protein RdgC [Deltaproteobacteria bacterium]